MNEITVRHFNEIPRGFTGKAVNKAGSIGFFQNSIYHRLDGPAFIYPPGKVLEPDFIINGHAISEENFWKHPLVLNYPPNILKKLNEILEG